MKKLLVKYPAPVSAIDHCEKTGPESRKGAGEPPRRLLLRGALLLGCGPWVPIALVGCDSKKDASSSRTAPVGAPATSAGSAAPAATTKVSPESVQYQAQPKGEQKCSACLNFVAESNTCKLVAGQVSPEGWCSLWTKKA